MLHVRDVDLIASLCSALFPAIGTFEHLQFGRELGHALPSGSGINHLDAFSRLRSGDPVILDLLEAQGVVTFPSFPTMLALITTFAWRGVPKIFGAMVGWNALVIVFTIPIGGHYGIDLLGGTIAWGVLVLLAARLAPPPTYSSAQHAAAERTTRHSSQPART